MNVNSINILEMGGVNVNNSKDASSDDDQLVIDTNKYKHKSTKKKQLPEKKSGVVTEMIPQLEVTQLKSAVKKSEEEAWLDAVESGDLELPCCVCTWPGCRPRPA